MTKQQAISKMILDLVAEGKDVITAMKKVIGEDLVEDMISDIYETLRAAQ